MHVFSPPTSHNGSILVVVQCTPVELWVRKIQLFLGLKSEVCWEVASVVCTVL